MEPSMASSPPPSQPQTVSDLLGMRKDLTYAKMLMSLPRSESLFLIRSRAETFTLFAPSDIVSSPFKQLCTTSGSCRRLITLRVLPQRP